MHGSHFLIHTRSLDSQARAGAKRSRFWRTSWCSSERFASSRQSGFIILGRISMIDLKRPVCPALGAGCCTQCSTCPTSGSRRGCVFLASVDMTQYICKREGENIHHAHVFFIRFICESRIPCLSIKFSQTSTTGSCVSRCGLWWWTHHPLRGHWGSMPCWTAVCQSGGSWWDGDRCYLTDMITIPYVNISFNKINPCFKFG